jgi:hypothetical protein
MKKRIIVAFLCVVAVICLGAVLCGFAPANVAYAEGEETPLVVGSAYTFSDDFAEYSVTFINETDFTLQAVKGGETVEYKGTYTYIGGKIVLKALGNELGTFYIQGSNLVRVVESEEENYTFLGRVEEWISRNYLSLVTTVGDAVLLIIIIVINNARKKGMLNITKKVDFSANTQSDIVDVTNELIKAYNDTEAELKKHTANEDAIIENLGAVVTQNNGILDILTCVYANSKNLPQGIKDLVNLKYANVQKALADAPALKELGASLLAAAFGSANEKGDGEEE